MKNSDPLNAALGKPSEIMVGGVSFGMLHLQVREHLRKLIEENFDHGDKFFTELVLIQTDNSQTNRVLTNV
jgi:hypothetical protein